MYFLRKSKSQLIPFLIILHKKKETTTTKNRISQKHPRHLVFLIFFPGKLLKNKKTCCKGEFKGKKILTETEMWNETEKRERVRRKRKVAEWNFI